MSPVDRARGDGRAPTGEAADQVPGESARGPVEGVTGLVGPPRRPPAVVVTRPSRLPTVAERVLPSGLRVLAVRRPGVPLVELRLRVPFAAAPRRGAAAQHVARASVLTDTLFTGTRQRDRLGIATDLQEVGGHLSAGVDADRLVISGTSLSTGLGRLLDVLADVLTGAAYPAREVTGERDRIGQELVLARSQPGTLAREALLRRLYGEHPYGVDLPTADAVGAVTPAALRGLHGQRLVPRGAILVLVGDLRPAAALTVVERALASWSGGSAAAPVPAPPALVPGPPVVVDRPGAVQTNIRLAGPAVPRTDPRWAALQVANIAFGGAFTSRLVANIRERRGYTYSPRSAVEHASAGSRFTVSADVATEVTAPALMEISYELARMALLPIDADELDGARRYAAGTLALSTATQSGLAGTLTGLVATGLGIGYLREHADALSRVTVDDVQEVAAELFAPSRLVAVLLGDAERVAGGLEALGPVEVAAAS